MSSGPTRNTPAPFAQIRVPPSVPRGEFCNRGDNESCSLRLWYPGSPRAALPPSYSSPAVLDLASRKGRAGCSPWTGSRPPPARGGSGGLSWSQQPPGLPSHGDRSPAAPGSRTTQTAPPPARGPSALNQPRLEQLQRQINCQTQCELLSRFCLCGFSKHLVSFLHLTICSNFYLNNFSLHCIFLSLKETPSLF